MCDQRQECLNHAGLGQVITVQDLLEACPELFWVQNESSQQNSLLDGQKGINACFFAGSCEAIYAALEKQGKVCHCEKLKAQHELPVKA